MNLLGMFAKYWEPGTVKTRLAATVGNEAAAELHHAFVRTLVHRLQHRADRRLLCFAPPEPRDAFKTIAAGAWSIAPQSEGDLGARMRNFFDTAFAAGATRVVLIGSDSPSLPAEYIDQAFEHLATQQVVLGPAEDGGYYLIGGAGRTPDVFEGVTWSSGEVWNQTVARLNAAGVSFAQLPMWYDVDQWSDLKRLSSDLEKTKSSPSLLELTQQILLATEDGGALA